ncbi:phosphatase [Salicibibacter halophilus]|uniref:Phosphatase n=1 Tax=Salicibibacter halophilus TaxID=2502791 RepID=A0A514LKK5_9BACI|nr:metallophosphoesterase [Salicibibacter halophilus]QDI92333.1 phosphatase [Salicibibacter halophilus]
MNKIAKSPFKLPVAILFGLTLLTFPHNTEASGPGNTPGNGPPVSSPGNGPPASVPGNGPPENVPGIPGDEPELVFPVISDTQIGRETISKDDDLEKFEESLNQLGEVVPNQDALVFLGDLTEHGSTDQYNYAMDIYDENKQDGIESLFAIGNHEYANDLSPEESQERFLDKTGMDSLYYHEVVNDYDFIVMGEEDYGYYSKEQIQWVDERLSKAEERDSEKPIFVFSHWPLEDTSYGSEWNLSPNGDFLYETLEKYPQVIHFAGHTHYPISDPRSIHQEDFTSVNTGSVNYMWTEDGYLQGELPPGHEEISNGLIVEVYDDEVVIERRGFHSNEWVGEPWVIDTPVETTDDFEYTSNRDNENPYFEKGSSATIIEDKTTSTELFVEFDQASDNLLVHSYEVTAIDKETDEAVTEYKAFSEYYKDPVPEKLELPINELEPDTDYEINVKAIDAFGNTSDESLTTIGKTSEGD